jgi:hypothetical protein
MLLGPCKEGLVFMVRFWLLDDYDCKRRTLLLVFFIGAKVFYIELSRY